LDWHPERRAGNAVVTPDFHVFSDPLPGSNTPVYKVPRVFVAVAPRPGANLSDPYRDQESTPQYQSLKALALSPNSEVQPRVRAFETTESQSSVSDSELGYMAKSLPLGRNSMKSKNH
jgi:hypothetical protein